MGNGTTLWEGTAFDCPSTMNEIILRHSQFSMPGGTSKGCNHRAIMGRSLRVENNHYTSQLNVTVSASLNNKTVQCVHNSDRGTSTVVGNGSLYVISGIAKRERALFINITLPVVQEPMLFYLHVAGNRYPPPNNVHLTDVRPGQVTFTWTSVSSSYCSVNFVNYSITSDCGVCPTTTNMTTVTCSDLQLSTEPVECTFRVSSVVCDLTGNPSEPVACSHSKYCTQLLQWQSSTGTAIYRGHNESNSEWYVCT